MTNGILMKVKSIAECSQLEHSAILLTCIKRQSVLKTSFGLLLEWPLKTDFTVFNMLDYYCLELFRVCSACTIFDIIRTNSYKCPLSTLFFVYTR